MRARLSSTKRTDTPQKPPSARQMTGLLHRGAFIVTAVLFADALLEWPTEHRWPLLRALSGLVFYGMLHNGVRRP